MIVVTIGRELAPCGVDAELEARVGRIVEQALEDGCPLIVSEGVTVEILDVGAVRPGVRVCCH